MSRSVNPDVAPGADRRREIAQAVYRVVARGGIEAASMREIAREAGCTTGSLTHHFADRRSLLDHTVGMAVADSMARLIASTRRDGLRAGLMEFLPLDERRRQENAICLVGVGASTRDPDLAASLARRYVAADDQLAQELRARLAASGRDAGEAEVSMLVDELLSAVEGIALYALADPGRYPPGRQLALVDRVLQRTGLA